MRPTRLLAALSLLATALALAACGSASSNPSTTPSFTADSSAASTATTPSAPAKVSLIAKAAAERRSAGRAAPFVKPQADNSIPTFGSESSGSDRGGAEAALRAYLSARARGDWAAACTGLAASLRQQTQAFAGASAKDCALAYQALAASTPAAERADPLSGPVLALRIKGASGFALFNGPDQQKYVMPMTREGGAWKVTQLAPVAYPLGSETQTSP
jgi:hypothetical protein